MHLNCLFNSLPTESIIQVFLFLSPSEIRKCQQICRLFRKVILDSSHLQYLLKLGWLGYSEPTHPRTDLSYDEKIRVLDGIYNSHTESFEGVTRLDLNAIAPDFSSIQFTRTTFVFGYPSWNTTRRLTVHQLPSINAGTASHTWQISDLGLDASMYRFDPDLDLLALLEVDHLPSDPGGQKIRRVHIRSLSSGLSHPLSAAPFISMTDRPTSRLMSINFQVVGRYVVLLSQQSIYPPPISSRVNVWDWIRAELVTFADTFGKTFVFVSDSAFVIPINGSRESQKDLGVLDVYTFDPIGSNVPACHVASLQLPTVPDWQCSSYLHVPFPPAPPAAYSFGTAPPTVVPRIYDLSPFSRYLRFDIHALSIASHSGITVCGFLFVPESCILGVISRRPENVEVGWTHWANGTYWINRKAALPRCESVFGWRAVLAKRITELDVWRILQYDLESSAVRRAKGAVAPLQYEDPVSEADSYFNSIFVNAQSDKEPSQARSLKLVPSAVIPAGPSEEMPSFFVGEEHVAVLEEQEGSERVLQVCALGIL